MNSCVFRCENNATHVVSGVRMSLKLFLPLPPLRAHTQSRKLQIEEFTTAERRRQPRGFYELQFAAGDAATRVTPPVAGEVFRARFRTLLFRDYMQRVKWLCQGFVSSPLRPEAGYCNLCPDFFTISAESYTDSQNRFSQLKLLRH